MTLSRRTLLLSSLVAALPAHAGEKPWAATFLVGGFDGEVHHAGLKVELLPGWKTYWRVPGAGGIPPDISVRGSNIMDVIVEHPLPQRFAGQDGETIGYKDEVVFPLRIVPQDKTKPVPATFMAFIGVCEVVCIPVKHEQQIDLASELATLPGHSEIQLWRMNVPQAIENGPIRKAMAQTVDGKPAIVVALAQPATDIFVEGNVLHYFNAPIFSADGASAILTVNGAKSLDDIRGQQLRLTVNTGSRGVEQRLLVV